MKRKLFIGLAIGLGITVTVAAIAAYRIVDNVRVMLDNYVAQDNEPYGDVPTLPNRLGPLRLGPLVYLRDDEVYYGS